MWTIHGRPQRLHFFDGGVGTAPGTCVHEALVKIRLEGNHLRHVSRPREPHAFATSANQELDIRLRSQKTYLLALKKLHADVVEALRPLHVNSGTPQRNNHGYRVQTRMTSLPTFVNDIATELYQRTHTLWKRKDRLMLLSSPSTESNFMSGTLDVRHHKNLTTRIHRIFCLECCLWPHLLGALPAQRRATRAQTTSPRRRPRFISGYVFYIDSQSKARQSSPSRKSIIETGLYVKSVVTNNRLRDHVQFVFDLWLWSTVGAALRVALMG